MPVTDPATANPPNYAVLLRRLACPALPFDPVTNPYLTIDVVDPATINDARQYTTLGKNPTYVQNISARVATGRTQPYAASTFKNQAPANPPAGQPLNTFFRHNGIELGNPASPTDPTQPYTLKLPFDWLVHLDRPLISKAELLHVSFCKPHELTQLFVQNGQSYQQVAPWQASVTRLYRFLELVDVAPRMTGLVPGGRIPGRINVNMVMDPTIIRAICQPAPGNTYAEVQVDLFTQNMLATRTPGLASPPLKLSAADQPYWGLGVGPAHGQDDLSVSPRGLGPLLGSWPLLTGQPYQKTEFLNKMFNNVTTRSNVFAIWVTAGFFEVDDQGLLGAEVGKAEGRPVRHRMFAIVDRTGLTLFATTSTPAVDLAGSSSIQAAPVLKSGGKGLIANPNTGQAYAVQPGSILVYEPGTSNEETVVVASNGQATFRKNHPAGCAVICRGNPGPWTHYDPRKDPNVVLYYAIIQ